MLPIGRGRVYWLRPRPTSRPVVPICPKVARPRFLDRFGDWYTPVPALIGATDEEAILRNDIVDRRPVHRWGEGRVTLLGDAAHPTTPNLGQGACQAIEDAVVLGKALRDADDPVAALRAYEDRRRARTPRS